MRGEQKSGVCHDKFQMPNRHPNGNIKLPTKQEETLGLE